MKTINILKRTLFALLLITFTGFMAYANNETRVKVATASTMAMAAAAMTKPAYITGNNEWVIDSRTVQGINPANGTRPVVTVTDSMTGLPVQLQACSCSSAKKAYRMPPTLNLIFTNASGATANCKYPSFDGVAEAVQGTLGSLFATLLEATNGAGTVASVNGTNIYGITALANQTASYALAIGQVLISNITGTAASGSLFTFNLVSGSFQGNETEIKQCNLIQSNAQSGVPIWGTPANDLWYLTANKYITVNGMPTGTSIKMQLQILGYKPYDEVL